MKLGIVGRIIVLRDDKERIFLTKQKAIDRIDFVGKLKDKFTACRIMQYNPETGKMFIEQESMTIHNSGEFELSSSENSDTLNPLWISRLILSFDKKETPNPYFFKSQQSDPLSALERFETIINVNIVDFTFDDGTAFYQLDWPEQHYSKNVAFKNPLLKKEYDAVKHSFIQLFGSNKIMIEVNIGKENNVIVYDKIFCEQIENFSDDWVKKLQKLVKQKPVSFVETNTDELSLTKQTSETFPNNEEKLIYLLNNFRSKHYHHLTFLSKLHDVQLSKLKNITQPESFIFSFKTNDSLVIVWESYDTAEATYIWKSPLDSGPAMSKHIESIELLILSLVNNEKRAYRNREKENKKFTIIEHNYKLPSDGFEQWQLTFNNFIQNG